jgi:hypothetical protein
MYFAFRVVRRISGIGGEGSRGEREIPTRRGKRGEGRGPESRTRTRTRTRTTHPRKRKKCGIEDASEEEEENEEEEELRRSLITRVKGLRFDRAK